MFDRVLNTLLISEIHQMFTKFFESFQKKLQSDTDQSEYLQPVTDTGAGGEKLQNYPSIDDAVRVPA